MIEILIVDDHQMVRLGLSSYLNIQTDMMVIGEADDGQAGVKQALELRPDVILMDLVMPKLDGIEATKQILKKWPEAKIIIVTSFIDDEKVFPAIAAGACGYLLKTSAAEEIAVAIRKIVNGEQVMNEAVSSKINQHSADNYHLLHDDLTNREKEVLLLIAQGKGNQEIADELFITLKTVKTHVSNILSKLEVSDRTQAAIYAFKHGLIQ